MPSGHALVKAVSPVFFVTLNSYGGREKKMTLVLSPHVENVCNPTQDTSFTETFRLLSLPCVGRSLI